MNALKVLIAPDKFKGTLTADAAAKALSRGWGRARPQDSLRLLPISDGGDGFGAAISRCFHGRSLAVDTLDAAHRPICARWWWEPKTKTAIIESAQVVGLAMLPSGVYHPFQLDTYGLGRLLARAEGKGARRCFVGLGGSATNDGGFGMARALGWTFLARNGRSIEKWTELNRVTELRAPVACASKMEVLVAVDVANPLLGSKGATRVYGPQKGIRPRDFPKAERCLEHLARSVERSLGRNLAEVPGAGAAGGLGFGFMAFCGARLVKGFELFAREAHLDRELAWADLVLTGEGCIDESTLMGKGVGELATSCSRLGKPCLALGGAVMLKRQGPFTVLRVLSQLAGKEDAMKNAALWLARLAASCARDWTQRMDRMDLSPGQVRLPARPNSTKFE